jgi:hypothetical protein
MTVHLGAQLSILGTVRVFDGASPPDAYVTAKPRWPFSESRVRVKGDTFMITGLPAGPVVLQGAADNQLSREVQAEAGSTNVLIVIGRTATIAGRVEVDGPLLLDESLVYVARDGVATMHLVDDDGAFEVTEGLEPGVEYQVRAVAHGYIPSDVTVTVPATDLVLRLQRGLEVRGRVALVDGSPARVPLRVEPVELAAFRAEVSCWDRAFLPQAVSNEDGSFLLGGLSPGRTILRVDASPYQPLNGPIVLDAGDDGVLVTLAPTCQLRGRVVTDICLDGFVVEAWPVRGPTGLEPVSTSRVDTGGFFTMRVPDATHVLVVWNDEDADDNRYVIAQSCEPQHEPTLVLGAGESVGGLVMSAVGRPMRWARVEIQTSYGWRQVWCNERGEFAAPGLPAGDYIVTSAGAAPTKVAAGSRVTLVTTRR